MVMAETTLIRVPKQLRDELAGLKMYKRETAGDVVERAIEALKREQRAQAAPGGRRAG